MWGNQAEDFISVVLRKGFILLYAAAPSSGHWPKHLRHQPIALNNLTGKKKAFLKVSYFIMCQPESWNKTTYSTSCYVVSYTTSLAERQRWERGPQWAFSTHAAVQQCAGSSSASPPRSSGNGCVSSCSPESRSPWRCPWGMEERRPAGPASPEEFCTDGTRQDRDVTNTIPSAWHMATC